MKTILVLSLLTFLSPAMAAEKSSRDTDSILSGLAVQASGAATYGDFIRATVKDAGHRKELEQFLKLDGGWDEKMPPLEFVGDSTLAFGDRETDPILLQFAGEPFSTMKFSGRVINLAGRSLAQINTDVEAAYKAVLFPSVSAWSTVLLPFAKASLAVGPRPAQVAAVGAAAGWTDPPAKRASVKGSVEKLEDSAEFKAIVEARSKFKDFSCGNDKGQPVVNIVRSQGFFDSFRISNIDAKTDGTYTLTKKWTNDSELYKCSYKVVSQELQISNNPEECDHKAAEKAKILDKLYSKKPSRKKSAEATAPALSVTKMLPGIPVGPMITCCQVDAKCHEKVLTALNPDRGGAKPATTKPVVH